jgi:hypothetical protein
MKIIVPAYNVKPEQAARFEAQIAAIMHMKRDEEINRFCEDKLPPKAGRDVPIAGGARLPDNDNRKTPITRGRQNNPTDELVLKILRDRELSASEVADMLRMTTQAMRNVMDRLVSRGEIRRRTSGYGNLFTSVGRRDG